MRIGQITAETQNPGEYRLWGQGEHPTPCGLKVRSGKYSWRFGEKSAFIVMPNADDLRIVRGRFAFRMGEALPHSIIMGIGAHVLVCPDSLIVDGKTVESLGFPLNTWIRLGFAYHVGSHLVLYDGFDLVGTYPVKFGGVSPIRIGGHWGDFYMDDYYLDKIEPAQMAEMPPMRRFVGMELQGVKGKDGFAPAQPFYMGENHKLKAVIPTVATGPDRLDRIDMQVFDGQNKRESDVIPDANRVYSLRLERQPDGSEWSLDDFGNMRFKFSRGGE